VCGGGEGEFSLLRNGGNKEKLKGPGYKQRERGSISKQDVVVRQNKKLEVE